MDYIFNNIKSLPHTGDLQTKAFQGHHKHKEIVEFRNISLINTLNFDDMTIETTRST